VSAGKGEQSILVKQQRAALSLTLLGRSQIRLGNEDTTRQIKYRKGFALMGYLAANAGVWQSRERIADLLWPEMDTAAARTNLRQVLNNLTSVLNVSPAVSPLQKDDHGIILNPLSGVRIDISLLSDTILNRVVSDEPDGRQWRQKEVEPLMASLSGEFLEGLQLTDTPDFDAWLEATRLSFRAKSVVLLEQVCRAQREEGRLGAAIGTARLLVSAAPLVANHTEMLMTLLLESGDGPAALEAFDSLRHRLETDCGTAPDSRLIALRDSILQSSDRRHASLRATATAMPELRWLVSLYCGFRLGKEENYAVDAEVIANVQALILQRGGTMASTAGRGLLAVFGLGDSVERSAERALLVASDIQQSPVLRLAPHIGISAGKVLVRAMPGSPHLIGESPDLASVIAWKADAGEILVSEAVSLQVETSFEFEAAGTEHFPGFEGDYKLSRLMPAPPAELVMGQQRATPFAGRQEESAELQSLWQEVCSGHSRIAVLRAPAGLGKTRMVEELSQWIQAQGGETHRIVCRLECQHQSLSPVLTGLETYTSISREDDPGTRRTKMSQLLDQRFPGCSAESRESLMTLIEGDAGLASDELLSKSAVFSAIIELVEQMVAEQPTLLVVDDYHWSDLATQELLGVLIRGLGHQQVLLAITTRPEIALDCPAELTRIFDLPPLDKEASLALVQALDSENSIPPAEAERITASAGGIPLFLERLVKSWLQGDHHLLPITELLQGELDRLGPAKDVLRAASVLGSQFSRQTLIDLLPDANVAAALSRAIAQRLVDAFSTGIFAFNHALIRDTVYASLPHVQRKMLHERAARLFQIRGGYSAEDVARHFSLAECWKEAAEWWVKAGLSATAREFASDAVACFQEALSMLGKMGKDGDDHFFQTVQLRLGYAAQVAQGFGSPLAHTLFSELAKKIEVIPTHSAEGRQIQFTALSGSYMGGSSQGKVEGLNIARRLEALAETEPERLMASFALGNSLFWRGQLDEASLYQKQGIALADVVPPKERLRYCVDDPAVTCRAFYAWNLWFLGDEVAAVAMAKEAIELARKGQRAHALCFALNFAVGLHWCRGSVDDVLRLGSESLALAKKYGFPLWEGVSSLFLLWAQAKSGCLADTRVLFGAAAMMQQAYQAGITTSRWIAVHALVEQGEWAEAERLLDVSIREADFNEDQYCLADLFWLKGRCLNKRGRVDEAQASLSQARELAQTQQAVGLLTRFESDLLSIDGQP